MTGAAPSDKHFVQRGEQGPRCKGTAGSVVNTDHCQAANYQWSEETKI